MSFEGVSQMKYLLKCGFLFDATEKGCLKKDMAVIIDGNQIKKVCPIHGFSYEGMEIIDLSNRFVMPGLIDGHVHVQFNSEPGGRAVVNTMSYGEVALKSLVNANIDLMAGFTTIRVMSAVGSTDIDVKRSIEKGWHKGPRMFCSGEPLGSTGGNGDTNYRTDIIGGAIGHIVNSPDEARKAARHILKRGADQIKLSAAEGFLDFSDNTGMPEMTCEEMTAAVEIAHMHNKIAAAHTYCAKSIENAVRAGADTIEHCVWVDDSTLDLMADKRTYMVPTIIVLRRMLDNAERFGIHGKCLTNLKNAIIHQREQIQKAIGKGIKIAFGTDAGTPFNPHGYQAEEFSLLVEAGLKPEEALLAATSQNAKMLRLDNEIGTIEPGKMADIVAFDENPIENIKCMSNCTFVMKDGEIFKY